MILILYCFFIVTAYIIYIIFILYTTYAILFNYLGIPVQVMVMNYHYIWLSYIIYSLFHIMAILSTIEELRVDKYLIPARDKHKFYSKTICLRKSLLAKILKQFYIFIINVVFIVRRRFFNRH